MYSTGLTDRYGKELISTIDFTGHVLTRIGSLSANKIVFVTTSAAGPYFALEQGDDEDTINIGLEPGNLISGINVRDPETGNTFSGITTLNSVTVTYSGPSVTTELVIGPHITVSSNASSNTVDLKVKDGNLLQFNNMHEGSGDTVYTTSRVSFYTITQNGPYIQLGESEDRGLLIGIGGGSGGSVTVTQGNSTYNNISTLKFDTESATGPWIEAINSNTGEITFKINGSTNGITINKGNNPAQTWTNITNLTFLTGAENGPYFDYTAGNTGELTLTLMPGSGSGGTIDFYNHNGDLVKSTNKVYMAQTMFSAGPYIDVTDTGDGVQLSYVGKFVGFANNINVAPGNENNLLTGSYLWSTAAQNGPFLVFNQTNTGFGFDAVNVSISNPSIIFAGQSETTGVWVQKLIFASSVENGPYINIEPSNASTGEYMARIYPGTNSSSNGITVGGGEGTFNDVTDIYFGTSSVGGPNFHIYNSSPESVTLELDYEIPDRIINHTDSGILNLQITPQLYNTYHTWSELSTSGSKTINLTCQTNANGTNICLTWHLIIDLRSVSTVPTITWGGTTINWLDGVPTIEAGKLHMISFQAINNSTIIGNLSYVL